MFFSNRRRSPYLILSQPLHFLWQLKSWYIQQSWRHTSTATSGRQRPWASQLGLRVGSMSSKRYSWHLDWRRRKGSLGWCWGPLWGRGSWGWGRSLRGWRSLWGPWSLCPCAGPFFLWRIHTRFWLFWNRFWSFCRFGVSRSVDKLCWVLVNSVKMLKNVGHSLVTIYVYPYPSPAEKQLPHPQGAKVKGVKLHCKFSQFCMFNIRDLMTRNEIFFVVHSGDDPFTTGDLWVFFTFRTRHEVNL